MLQTPKAVQLGRVFNKDTLGEEWDCINYYSSGPGTAPQNALWSEWLHKKSDTKESFDSHNSSSSLSTVLSSGLQASPNPPAQSPCILSACAQCPWPQPWSSSSTVTWKEDAISAYSRWGHVQNKTKSQIRNIPQAVMPVLCIT